MIKAGLWGHWRQWIDDRRGGYLLLILSLTIKVIIVAADGDAVNRDSTLYITVAKAFAAGDFQAGLDLFPLPFYPLAIAGMHLIVPDWVLSGQIISCAALSLALIPLYLLSRDMFGARAAFWAGAAFVVSPQINSYADELIRDPLFILFLGLFACFAVRALERRRKADFLLATIFSLFAFFSRVEGGILLPVFWTGILILILIRREERAELASGGLLCFLPVAVVGIFLILLPGFDISAFNRFGEVVYKGKMFFSGDFLASYHSIYNQLEVFEKTIPGWNQTQNFAEITRHFLWLVYLVGLLEYLVKDLYAPFLLLLLSGFAVRPLRRGHWLIISLVIAFILIAYIFHIQNNFVQYRYLLAPAFLLYPWIGAGVEHLRFSLSVAPRKNLAFSFLLMIILIVPVQKTLADLDEKDMIPVAGRWLARQPDMNSMRWMSTDPRLPLYAGWTKDFIIPDLAASGTTILETLALEYEIDLLTVEISALERNTLPEMKNFEIIRRFEGTKNDVIIYRRRQ